MKTWLDLISILKNFKGNTMLNTLILIASLVAGGMWLDSSVVEPLQNITYHHYTTDLYRYVEFDLSKQMGKLAGDVSDMKTSDVFKFDYYCNSYFGNEYLKYLDAERQRVIKGACEVIGKLYTEKFPTEVKFPLN